MRYFSKLARLAALVTTLTVDPLVPMIWTQATFAFRLPPAATFQAFKPSENCSLAESCNLAALLTSVGAPGALPGCGASGEGLGRPGGPLHPHQQPLRTRAAPVAIWGLSVRVVPEMHGSPQWPRAKLGSRRRRAPGAPGRSRFCGGLWTCLANPSVGRKRPSLKVFRGRRGNTAKVRAATGPLTLP